MKKNTLLILGWCLCILLLPFFAKTQTNNNLQYLFTQLKQQPISKSDVLKIEQAKAAKKIINSQFYPDIDAIGKYDYASIPTSMYPLPPNELLPMVQNQSIPQPFSKNIYRLGAAIAMPIFVKSIYTLSSQAKIGIEAAVDQQYLNLIKNEAIIVSSNANLIYLQQLDSALSSKRNSLLITKSVVVVKVNNGRAPETVLTNINNAINELDILKNDLHIQKEEITATIANLTGVSITEAIPMQQIDNIKEGEIKSLLPLQKKVTAAQLSLQSEKDKLLPSLYLLGNYTNNFANAYNNNKSINTSYTTMGLLLKFPLFNKSQWAKINQSKINVESTNNELSIATQSLQTQAQQLLNTLQLLQHAVQLYQNSIKEKETLLQTAKVSFSIDQMTIEDYLKYEDDVVFEKTKLYKTQAQIWQTLMKLAVIYGNDIQTIVK